MSVLCSALGMAANTIKPVSFVGYAIDTDNNGAEVQCRVPYNTEAGDHIIVMIAVGLTGDQLSNMSITETGYLLSDGIWANDTYDASVKVFTKVSDGSETTVTMPSIGNNTASCAMIVMVFRDTDRIHPSSTDTGMVVSADTGNTDDITWEEVTGLTQGQCLVYIGAVSHINGDQSFTAGGDDLDLFVEATSNDSYDVTVGMGYLLIKSQTSFTANTWELTGSGTSSDTARMILQLSPAA